MTTTNDLNIKNNGIPIFNTASGSFSATVPPEDQALVGGANGTILGVDPTGYDVGNPLCNTGVGTPPNYSATPTVDSLTIINNPSNPTDATNKQYVDLIASNFSFLDATLCATTTNLNASYLNGASGIGATLTNAGPLQAFSVDNYNPIATNRVLIKDQTSAYENGVYEITVLGDSLTAWILTRTLDYDAPSEIIPGSLVSVLYGDTNGDTIWAETQQITNIGTDPIQFVQFNSGSQGALLAANNLSDVQDVATSRNNLGLTNVATQNVTQYSVLLGDASDGIVSLPTGAYGQVLTSGGPGVNPSWLPVSGGSGFSSINVQVFDTAGTYTYTPSANMQYCIVELLGAGGAGGVFPTDGNVSSNDQIMVGGGGSGAYCKSLYDAATIGTSQTVIIGAGGSGIVNNNGQNGGLSQFGTTSPLMIANGGIGGQGKKSTITHIDLNIASGGNIVNKVGSLASSGNYLYKYATGSTPFSAVLVTAGNSGQGASSIYGSPPSNFAVSPLNGTYSPASTTQQGAGGNAGVVQASGGGTAKGGNGGPGLCIITEFIGG